LRMAILRVLGEAGIEIPFPQRDLHIRYGAGTLEPVAVAEPGR
jgi:small-conductance mechanosensitive channel